MRREDKKIKINPREIYDSDFRQAYEREDYREAALILLKNPNVNKYLSGEETIEIILCYQNLLAQANKTSGFSKILTLEVFAR